MLEKVEKIEVDGWVFYIDVDRRSVYKSRPDGSWFMQISPLPLGRTASKFRDLELKDGRIYYCFDEEYSELDDELYDFYHYRDTVTSSLLPSEEEPVEEKRSHVYLGTSGTP